jgi:hypothetical protein
MYKDRIGWLEVPCAIEVHGFHAEGLKMSFDPLNHVMPRAARRRPAMQDRKAAWAI